MIRHFRYCDWFWVLYLVALGWLWYPLWAQSHIPAFRDGFHFYYPQFYWLENCYRSGDYFPKWIPNEGLGASVWGQPTWQIFYPLRVLWLLPLFSLPQLYAIWIIIHQVIAALGMKKLAAEYQLSINAGWFAGISYSLGYPILFQYSNMVYLCSAAWIGWSLIPITRMLNLGALSGVSEFRQSHWNSWGPRVVWRAALYMGHLCCVCGMMVVCGDPHTAVNAILIGLGSLIAGAVCNLKYARLAEQQSASDQELELHPQNKFSRMEPNKVRIASSEGQGRGGRRFLFAPVLRVLTFACVVALVVLQSVASWNWYRYSSRDKQPLVVTDSFNSNIDTVLKDDSPQVMHRIFDFSVSPWSLPSFVWPTIGGFYQPVNSRWVDALESEGRMWTPSLYLGLLTLMLGLSRLRPTVTRPADRKLRSGQRFLFWTSLIALFAAMGNYSFTWLLRQILTASGFGDWSQSFPSDSSGSLYGMLTLFVPGYDSFRYPAKWIAWTAAGLTFSAAVKFDQWTPGRAGISRLRLPAIGVGVVSVATIVCWSLILLLNPEIQPVLSQWLAKSNDPLLGYAKAPQVIQDILFALHWPIVILSLVGIGIIALPKRIQLRFLLIVCAGDLLVCAKHWTTFTSQPPKVTLSEAGRSSQVYWANVRLADINDLRLAGEQNDQGIQTQLQQTLLLGKLGLLSGVATFHASGSLRPQAVVKIERWLSEKDTLQANQPELDEVLSHLGISRRLVRAESGGYQWRDIQSAKACCEIIPNRSAVQNPKSDASSQQGVHWIWISNSKLTVRVVAEYESTLLVRQFNDGYWDVECSTMGQLKPLEGELFVAVPLKSGTHVIQLSRKSLY